MASIQKVCNIMFTAIQMTKHDILTKYFLSNHYQWAEIVCTYATAVRDDVAASKLSFLLIEFLEKDGIKDCIFVLKM